MAPDHDIQQLTAAARAQQESIQQLTDSVGLLAQCVAMLLEEEMGSPVQGKQEAGETDMDGNPVLGECDESSAL